MENLGSILREKRKSLGVSLEHISEELRIKLQYLEALEEGRDELLPDPLYKKIFLKAYADYLGLKFEVFSPEFDKKKKRRQEDTEPSPPGINSAEQRNITLLLIILAMLLGFLSFFVFLKHRGAKIDYQKSATETKLEQFEEQPSDVQSQLHKDDKKQIPPQPEEMTLRLKGLDKTWALVLGEGVDTLFSGFINEGMIVECKTPDRFRITLGRAWVVEGYLNGKKLKPFAPEGKSIYGRVIKKDNYKDFLEITESK